MARLDEIIIGTSISDYECFERAKENYVESDMFEDAMLSSIFEDIERCYENGQYDKQSGVFDLLAICGDDYEKSMRVLHCIFDCDFRLLKWHYNFQCKVTGRGNWTDLTFDDYIVSFIKQYAERCREERKKQSYQ